MPDATWGPAQNFIDNATDGNYKHAYDIFDKHDSLLHGGIADADISGMYTYFHVYKTAYVNAYGVWMGIKGTGTSGTANFTAMLDDLSGNKIRAWDVAIQVVYDQKSIKYQALLPNRRNPFQKGSINSRIAAIAGLLNTIGSDASLATLKGQITTFNTALLAARDSQQGNFGAIDSAISALDTARINAAQAMFKNYGSLVVKYYQTPKNICNYMPVEMLQTTTQILFNGTTDMGLTDHVLKRKMDVDTHLHLKNDSDSPEEFFFTDGMTETPAAGQSTVVLAPHTQQDVTAGALGYTDAARHLYVKNNGGTPATWHVQVG